jgi:hypothetical protein
MINFLIFLLVMILVYGILWYVVARLPLPAPFDVTVQVILALIFIFVLLGALYGGVPVPVLMVR